MKFIAIGINHKRTSVRIREKYSFTRKLIHESLAELKYSRLVGGAVILSTCNRAEIYLALDGASYDMEKAKSLAIRQFRAQKDDVERYFYIFEDMDAVRHLFRVASGLDSQVLGENQILAQVRSAWSIAKEEDSLDEMLDNIFKRAVEAGRMIRSETRISHGNISIGSVAIKMLKDRLGNLHGHSALIIGAGKTGALVSNYLKEEQMNGVFVASRTYTRAVELASSCGGRAADMTQLEEELKNEDVDIVISSTSSPHIILKREMLIRVMAARKKPLFIMDLALPRDVDPAAMDIAGIDLYDLDDLKCVIEENYKNREREALLAERLVLKEVDRFARDCAKRGCIPNPAAVI